MIVSGLLVDPRRRESVQVQIDGRTVWTVAGGVVTELGLREGERLPSGASERLEAAAEQEAALRAGMRLVARRAHAVAELRTKLEVRGHAAPAIDGAVDHLVRIGVLDDGEYAVAFAAARVEKGIGPARISRELGVRGIAGEVAAAALRNAAAGGDGPWRRTAAQAGKRAEKMAGLTPEARRRRLLAFLARRGFDGEEARSLARELARGGDTVD